MTMAVLLNDLLIKLDYNFSKLVAVKCEDSWENYKPTFLLYFGFSFTKI